LVEESRVPGENHRPVTSHWQTLSHNVVSSGTITGGKNSLHTQDRGLGTRRNFGWFRTFIKDQYFSKQLIYCRHFRTYSRCAMFDWSDTVFRRRNVTRRRISNTVLQPRYWGREADSPEVCLLGG
jgi:hypothetical protein